MNPKTLYLISYGLYIVASRQGERRNAQVANAVFQVTSEPPRLAIGINKANLTHEFIADSGVFAVSILRQETPLPFIGGFGFRSGRDADKLADVAHRDGETGAPIVLDNALGYLEARVVGTADAGTHTIFIGEVVAAEVVADGTPLTYAHYQQVKRGSTPPSAPSYVAASAPPPATPTAERAPYVCTVCGYVYDPAVGDPDGGIPAGTPFAALPDDWVCPVCGADKSQFKPA